MTLRLVQPWFGSKRTVIGDSAFASFSTCVALLSMGLFFIGIVKTATSKFPKAFFNAWESTKPVRGSHMFLTTVAVINTVAHTIMAVGWKCKMVKCFISSVGNCLNAVPQILNRTRVVLSNDGHYVTENYDKTTTRVQVVYWLFKYFSVIDIHDHFRQGILKIEEHWRTITWWHRIFATIMGIIYTNAYFYYREDYKKMHGNDLSKMFTYEQFLGKLAFEMVQNDFDDQTITISSLRKRNYDELNDNDNVEHVIKPNLMHPLWQTRKASTNNKAYRSVGYCSVCHQKCGFYCATCSDDCSCVSVCNPTGSNFQCFLNHQKSTIEDSNSKYRFKSKARRVTP